MLNSRYFIGIILIIIGLIFLYEEFYDKDLPIFKILIPLVLIIVGAQLIFSSRKANEDKGGMSPVILSTSNHKVKNDNLQGSYAVILGEQKIDLTHCNPPETNRQISIITILGDTKIFVPPHLNWKIQGSVLLGEQTFPDGSEKNFGDEHYTANEFNPDEPYLLLDCKTLLGEMKVFVTEEEKSTNT